MCAVDFMAKQQTCDSPPPAMVSTSSADNTASSTTTTTTTKETKMPLIPSNNKKSTKKESPYQVSLSIWFVTLMLFLSTMVSFQVGTLVRRNIAAKHLEFTLTSTLATARTSMDAKVDSISSGWFSWLVNKKATIEEGKSKKWVHCDDNHEDFLCSIRSLKSEHTDKDGGAHDCDSSRSDDDSDDDDDDDDDPASIHSTPLAQHLLVDLSTGVMDMDDLLPTLLRLTSSKGWSLKSHLCHDQVICVFLFDQGHRMVVNPNSQTLDIFSADSGSLLNWLDSMPFVQGWAYQPRATPYNPAVFDAGLNDMYNFLLGSTEFTQKRLVARAVSSFQEVTIYDTIDPRILSYSAYQASQVEDDNDNNNDNESYYKRNAHLFQADRQMFLDGVVQSRKHGERAYHEALVHPAMMMHPNPQRVAIIGAGEGATLREVLKHSCIKEVVMIEIDSYVMDLSRRYLQQWNDCSDLQLPDGLVNPTGNCFDDPRAKVHATDAIRWFMERYPENSTSTYETFDVVIMDALDPGDKVEFSDVLFDNMDLAATFYRSLSPNGIFISQMGEQQHLEDTNPMWTRDKHALFFVQNLGKVGFQRFYNYEEASTRFSGLWSFTLASKASDTSRWHANAAQVDLELQQRAMPTKSGGWPFHYFDGATMQSYRTARRSVGVVQCLTNPHWPACQRGAGLFKGSNVPAAAALTMKDSTVVAGQDLEPGMFVGLEECVHQTLDFPHDAFVFMEAFKDSQVMGSRWDSWFTILDKFSLPINLYGEQSKIVDLGHDSWKQDCPINNGSLLEPFETGRSNAMQQRFWRIHTCAAKRIVKHRVSAGSPVPCSRDM